MGQEKVNLSWIAVEERAKGAAEVLIPPFKRAEEAIRLFGVPRGGIPAAQLIHHQLVQKGFPDSYLEENPDQATVFVDDIIDSGRTREKFALAYPGVPFVSLITRQPGDKAWYVFPWERMTEETGPQENIVRILQFIGENPQREGLVDTPSRVVRSWDKLYGGYKQDEAALMKTAFVEGACDEMVVLRDIEFYSTCEHHMLPFSGRAHIGYIPQGRVIGVSKIARLLEVFSRRLQIQERIGEQVTNSIMQHLQPLGCGCVLEAQHFCMTSRGVEKQNSVMVTSSLQGNFKTKPEVRAEFLRMIGK